MNNMFLWRAFLIIRVCDFLSRDEVTLTHNNYKNKDNLYESGQMLLSLIVEFYKNDSRQIHNTFSDNTITSEKKKKTLHQ